jgi:hypothetical protein
VPDPKWIETFFFICGSVDLTAESRPLTCVAKKKTGGLEHKSTVPRPAGSLIAKPPGSPGMPFDQLSDNFQINLM